MTDAPKPSLIADLRHVLHVGGTDERFAISWFHELVDRHGPDEMRRAMTALAEATGSSPQKNLSCRTPA